MRIIPLYRLCFYAVVNIISYQGIASEFFPSQQLDIDSFGTRATANVNSENFHSQKLNDSRYTSIDLYDSIHVFNDLNGDQTIEDIISNPQWFAPNNTQKYYGKNDCYWTKITLRKKTFEHNSILHLSSNNWNASWSNINVWIINSTGDTTFYGTGYDVNRMYKPIDTDLNLIDLSKFKDDDIVIICRLQGSAENTRPNFISYWLVDSDYSPGLLPSYPFKGHFQNKSTNGAFRTNPISTFEIVEWVQEPRDIYHISSKWNTFLKTSIFDAEHKIGGQYWIKLKLKGSTHFHGEQILHISSESGNDQFSFDYVDIYTTTDQKTFTHQITGDQVPLSGRPIAFWANFITVNLAPTDSMTLYMNMRGVDSRYLMPTILLHHVDSKSLFPQQNKEAWDHGVFTGILGIKFIFFLLLALVGREKIYLYFSIMSLGFFMVLGFDDNMYSRFVAFPELRNQHIFLFYTGLYLSQLGFFNFTKIYFNYENGLTRRFINAFLITSFLIHVYAYCQLQFAHGISGYAHLPHALVALSILIGIISVIIMAIRSAYSKESSKILFLSAFIPLTITVFIALSRPILTQIFGELLFTDQLAWANHQDSVKFAIVFMLTMLAVSVGMRTMKLKMDKATALKFVEKNKIIKAKSNQNEILMKEIHHRVKNNLQILSSLLSLQSNALVDENAIDALKESRNRVESMGLIHQRLYTNDNISSVNMKEYISELCRHLEDSFSTDKRHFQIYEEVQYETIDVDYAIPLGLVINELVTNSIKYAFKEDSNGELNLNLKESEQGLELIVADNGQYIDNVNPDQIQQSFGSQLIRTLSKKMKGSITIDTEQGYKTRIVFKRYTGPSIEK